MEKTKEEVTVSPTPMNVNEGQNQDDDRNGNGNVFRERPSFRSVANAIRTAIFIEKTYRQTSMPPQSQPKHGMGIDSKRVDPKASCAAAASADPISKQTADRNKISMKPTTTSNASGITNGAAAATKEVNASPMNVNEGQNNTDVISEKVADLCKKCGCYSAEDFEKSRQIECSKLAQEKQLREKLEHDKAVLEQRIIQYEEDLRIAKESLQQSEETAADLLVEKSLLVEQEVMLLQRKASEAEDEVKRIKLSVMKTEDEKQAVIQKEKELEDTLSVFIEEAKLRSKEADELKREVLVAR